MSLHEEVFIWPPPSRGLRIKIHVPASILSVEHGLVKKTFVLGLIARALAIFRVDSISIYRDPDSRGRDIILAKKVLEYIATPPYLRKRIFKIDRDLKAVGILPPLATASHPLEDDLLREHTRPALVLSVGAQSMCIEPGLDGEICIDRAKGLHVRRGDIIYVRTLAGGIISGVVDPIEAKKIYWGYSVETHRSMRESISSSDGDLYIVSTKKGSHNIEKLSERVGAVRMGIDVIFGSPDKDPDEIAMEEGWDLESIDHYKLNSAPLQGVRSIRTYEAIYITLAILNSIIYRVKQI